MRAVCRRQFPKQENVEVRSDNTISVSAQIDFGAKTCEAEKLEAEKLERVAHILRTVVVEMRKRML
jgi:hypothetical protein